MVYVLREHGEEKKRVFGKEGGECILYHHSSHGFKFNILLKFTPYYVFSRVWPPEEPV
jgi:hypothetical protein